jgi:hypothetical protein
MKIDNIYKTNKMKTAQQKTEALNRLLSPEFKLANNLSFFLADILQTLFKLMDDEKKRKGLIEKTNVSAAKTAIKFAVSDIRRLTRGINESDQSDFGETCDRLMKLLVLISDRSEDNDKVLDLTIDFVEKFESKRRYKVGRFGV